MRCQLPNHGFCPLRTRARDGTALVLCVAPGSGSFQSGRLHAAWNIQCERNSQFFQAYQHDLRTVDNAIKAEVERWRASLSLKM